MNRFRPIFFGLIIFNLFTLALLTGCGSTSPQPLTTAPKKAISEIRNEDRPVYERLIALPDTAIDTFYTHDALPIAYRKYIPMNPDSMRVVVAFIHGTAAQSKLYIPFAETLQQAGIGVALIDLRGHGLSGGERGDSRTSDALARDVRIFLDTLRRQFPERKIILGGHSLGAGVAQKYVEFFANRADRKKTYQEPDGFVFMSGGFLLEASGDSVAAMGMKQFDQESDRSFAKVDPWLSLAAIPLAFAGVHPKPVEIFMPQQDALIKAATDKNLFTLKYSLQFFLASFPLASRETYRKITAPVLFVIGTEDELFSVAGARFAFEKMGQQQKELIVSEGANHVSVVWKSAAAVAEWINRTFAAPQNLEF
ncbi:MAG: alpha/beta fold hydrolase [Rhizobacter sp.]|nr:alpha/beta fold hydrolase [Chlorobiales bacterium]